MRVAVTATAILWLMARWVMAAQPLAYIATSAGTVVAVDTATDAVVGSVVAGSDLLGVAVHPSGRVVYAGSNTGRYVAVIDAPTMSIIGAIPLQGFHVGSIALSPDGMVAYVANESAIAIIDTASASVQTYVPTPILVGWLALDPTGTQVFASGEDGIVRIDVMTHASSPVARVLGAKGMVVSADASVLYGVLNGGDPNILIADPATLLGTFASSGGVNGYSVALTPDGTRLLATTTGVPGTTGRTSVLDTATASVVGTVLGVRPTGVDVHPDGSRAYVTDEDSNAVSVIDLTTATLVRSIPVPGGPRSIGHFIGPQPICGDGSVTFPEECDDGGTASGDCCSPSCEFESAGSSCGEGLVQCVLHQCNATGVCVSANAPDGVECDSDVSDTCSLPDTCHAGDCMAGGGGDADGDRVCNADDNCPSVSNSDQGDLDHDEIGNLCDVADAPFSVTQVRLRGSSASTPNGYTSVKGDFVVLSSTDAVTTASGMSVRLQDAFGTSPEHTWLATECVNSSSARVSCRSLDRAAKLKLRPLRASPGTYRLAAQLRRLDIQPPFAGPVLVRLSYGASIDRAGPISLCGVVRSGLKCPP